MKFILLGIRNICILLIIFNKYIWYLRNVDEFIIFGVVVERWMFIFVYEIKKCLEVK